MVVPFALLQILAPVACRRVSFSLTGRCSCAQSFGDSGCSSWRAVPSLRHSRVHQRAWGSPSCFQSPQEQQQQQRVTSWQGVSYASSLLVLMTTHFSDAETEAPWGKPCSQSFRAG